jgi:hypothetical protein
MNFKVIIPALIILNFLPFPALAGAQEPCLSSRQSVPTPSSNLAIPDIIERGFETFKNQGIEAVLEIWLPVKESSLARSQMLKFSQLYPTVEEWLGSYLNHELLYLHQVTDTTQVVYIESHHQRGSLFWQFVVSSGETDWRVTNLNISTDPNLLIPPYILYELLKTTPPSNICENQQLKTHGRI